MKTFNDQSYNTHQKSILSNTVTESNVYHNYSYTSHVNWEIKKTSETPSKKELYIDNLETSLKKTDFNIIDTNNEINDMNDNTRNHSNNDLLVDIYSDTAHNNTNQRQTTGCNVYTITDNQLQSSSDLEDLDWDSTNSHTSELIIAYNNKTRNKILYPRTFYALYVKPNREESGHLVYRLDKDQVVVTKNY